MANTTIGEKALNEKLMPFAGWHLINTDTSIAQWEIHIDGRWKYRGKHEVIQFSRSLNSCFAWLVPKAIERLRIVYSCELTEAEKRLMGRWLGERDDNHQLNWTQALCLAIEKIADAEARHGT